MGFFKKIVSGFQQRVVEKTVAEYAVKAKLSEVEAAEVQQKLIAGVEDGKEKAGINRRIDAYDKVATAIVAVGAAAGAGAAISGSASVAPFLDKAKVTLGKVLTFGEKAQRVGAGLISTIRSNVGQDEYYTETPEELLDRAGRPAVAKAGFSLESGLGIGILIVLVLMMAGSSRNRK